MSRRDSRTPEDIRELKNANNERLRNAFEEIFDKYAHDFSIVGDEIDLATGEIVVNNGHIERMRDEQDVGLAAPTFLRDWAQDVRVKDSQTGNGQQASISEDDLWEDVDEDEQTQEGQDARDVDNTLMDELAGNDRDATDLHSSRPNLSEPPVPNVGRERPSQNSPAKQRRANNDSVSSQPPFDRKIVQAFADNIANQITDFIMYMASSIQQQVSNPSLGNVMSNQRTDFEGFEEFANPPSKRRRVGSEMENSQLNTSPSVARNPLPKSSLQRLQLDPRGHAHRGRTPGMPSLWSEDETDYYSKKKRRKATKSTRLAHSSSLRNEVIFEESLTPASRRELALLETTIPNVDDPSSDESDEGFISSRLAPSSSPANGQRSMSLDGRQMADPGAKEVLKKTYHKRLKRPFTTKDDVRMIELYYKGLNWEEISSYFPGTSKNQIRYHFQKNLAVGDTQTYEPRPNIFTPPQSPRNGSEQPESVSRLGERSKPKSKSVTFVSNAASAASPSLALPGYHVYPNNQTQPTVNQVHQPTFAVHGAIARNLLPTSIAYGAPVNAMEIVPAPSMQRHEYGNEDGSEPVQVLQIPAERSAS